ncbi:MAG: ATP synthase F1 subunit epsilon [Lachnospiraceae bacterium]|jgi:F-type H+-transporting ATPase subunit epsilon|nr:ATP synthase F1 subunit epsilon [Lachnospiraceae bacterium]
MATKDNATFTLRLLAANREVYNGRAICLIIPATDHGEVGILAHHEDMIVAVESGEMDYQTPDEKWHHFAVSRGTVQVANNRVTALVLTAETPEEIDERRAEEAKARALEAMRQKQSINEYNRTQASLARALSRLKVKEKQFM